MGRGIEASHSSRKTGVSVVWNGACFASPRAIGKHGWSAMSAPAVEHDEHVATSADDQGRSSSEVPALPQPCCSLDCTERTGQHSGTQSFEAPQKHSGIQILDAEWALLPQWTSSVPPCAARMLRTSRFQLAPAEPSCALRSSNLVRRLKKFRGCIEGSPPLPASSCPCLL